MKEEYYSHSSLDRQAQIFLREVMPLRAHHKMQLNFAKVALLVIDLQKFFFDRRSHAYVPSMSAIIPRVLKLQDYCLHNGIKVIQTCHSNTADNAGMMAKWWYNHVLAATDPRVEIIEEIAQPEIKPIAKSQYDAFYHSVLASVLRAYGIEQLIITGVMTHLCCETTARVAFTRGYEVFFCIDGTATYNRSFHLGSLLNLAHGVAIPMLVAEVIEQLENSKKI